MTSIANINRRNVAIILIAILLVFSYFLFDEITGLGLTSGMFYRSFGNVVYVVFYGGLAYSFYEFLIIYINSKGYVSHDRDFLFINGKNICRINEILSCEIESNFLNSKSLLIKLDGERIVKLKLYLIDRPGELIRKDISLLGRQRPK